ncbi:hypothetical protein [Photobacterium swingsii]|uniref:hypothetical protein n=1 Tax=Photobacterium swingsii TaxID=680026 RepID=UPI0011B2331B|nr:hypothetical protein [Photobacterium swingsii]
MGMQELRMTVLECSNQLFMWPSITKGAYCALIDSVKNKVIGVVNTASGKQVGVVSGLSSANELNENRDKKIAIYFPKLTLLVNILVISP